MVQRNHRSPFHFGRSFDHPIRSSLLVKAAGITNKFFYFSKLILTSGDPHHFLPFIPEPYPAATGWAIPMCIHRFGKPYPVLEAEGLVSQGTHRTYINHISGEIIVNRFLDIGRNFCPVTTVHNTVYPLLGQLICHKYTAETHDTTVHVQLDFISYIYTVKCTFGKFISGFSYPMLIRQVLQITFACLVTYRAIQWMVDQ